MRQPAALVNCRAAAAPTVGELWGAVAAALLALAGALGLWLRVRRAERLAIDREAARRGLEQTNAELARFLDAAPLAFLRWGGEAAVASPALRAALRLGDKPLGGAGELAMAFVAADGRRLSEAASALAADGTPCQLDLSDRYGRCWRARGQRLPQAGQPNLIWFEDISAARELAAAAEHRELERQQLAQVLRVAPFAAWRRDEAGAIAWRNAAHERIVGHADGELEEAALPGRARALAAKVRQTGGRQSERRHLVVDGQRRCFEVLEIASDGAVGSVDFAFDITPLEESEAAGRRLEEAQGEVVNQLSAAVAIFGADKRLAYFNSAYARLWQLDEGWLQGKPHNADLIDRLLEQRALPEEPDIAAFKARMLAKYRDLLSTEDSLMYLPDGTTLRRLVTPHPQGGLIYIYEDVTDRLRLERSYNTLIAVQRETLDNLHEGVALFGTDGRLKLSNPAFQRIWHLESQQLQNEPHVSELVDAGQGLFPGADNWQDMRQALIASAFERRARGGRMERPNGSIIDFASVPLPDGDVLFTYLDVTDAARVERALRERNEALEAAERLQREFVANVSYELRTPLNVIIGFTEMLALAYPGPLNQRQQGYCQDILRSSQQLLELINAILDLAGIEAGQLVLSPTRFKLRPLLDEVTSLARERARAQDILLEIACADDLELLAADPRRLKQSLAQLVGNALKFTPGGGRVEFGAERRGEEIALWVADNGVGIAEEDLPLVLDKFQRGRRNARQHGAGLGLSLVKSIVELHGGRVEISSQVAAGTRVTCILPLAPAAAEPASRLAAA